METETWMMKTLSKREKHDTHKTGSIKFQGIHELECSYYQKILNMLDL